MACGADHGKRVERAGLRGMACGVNHGKKVERAGL